MVLRSMPNLTAARLLNLCPGCLVYICPMSYSAFFRSDLGWVFMGLQFVLAFYCMQMFANQVTKYVICFIRHMYVNITITMNRIGREKKQKEVSQHWSPPKV